MPSETRPLLTIAVPTFNRATTLQLLLETLAPQVEAMPEIELLVSDNASDDDTPQVMQRLIDNGLRCRYIRNTTNIEADPNFLQCYHQARGTYVWIFGDDDILLPGSLSFVANLLRQHDADLLYLQPFGFVDEVNERGQQNTQPAVYEYTSAPAFLHAVGLRGDLVMLSSVVVNKDRVESQPYPDFTLGYGTNLLQMGWVFSALKQMRKGLLIERGLFAVSERNPRRGFEILKVFGPNWAAAARTYLSPDQALIRAALQDQLYSWFATNWYGSRRNKLNLHVANPVALMRPDYGRLWQFWVLVWPLLAWPLLPAGGWLVLLRGVRSVDLKLNRARSRRVA